MKTIHMETTKKSPEQTSSEIQKLLKNYGLTKFMLDYEDGNISGCIFILKININSVSKEVPINLPIKWKALWIKAQNGETKYIKTEDQAKKVAWRIALRWMQSQLAYVDSEMVEIAEVFLPYMMVSKGMTIYQHLVANDMKLIENKL